MQRDGSGDRRTIARRIASFVSDLEPSGVPDDAMDVAERSFVDTVGVVLAGWGEGETEIARTISSGDSTGLLGDRGSELEVAFVNAMAGHCLDFDDCWRGGAIHPSVTVIPALFALCDGDTSGEALLTAYVAGIETQGYLAGALLPAHYEAGWHATATIGTFGVAAAASNLLGLDDAATENALNVAASLPGGLKRNFGTTTKSIHAGQAARSGITAARLASGGATADEHAIDGTRGFVELYDGNAAGGVEVPERPGSVWSILDPGIQLKKFPCCNFTHASIEAALRLRRREPWVPDGVDRISVSVSEGAVETVTHQDPTTALEAKFSFPYTVAAALATGSVTLESFDVAAIRDPETQRLRERVSVVVDPELSYESLAAAVTVESDDGEAVTAEVGHPPGADPNPLSEDDLRGKFRRCVAEALEPDRADEVFEFLRSLRERDSLETLAGV